MHSTVSSGCSYTYSCCVFNDNKLFGLYIIIILRIFVKCLNILQAYASTLLEATKMTKSSQVPAGKEILVGGKHFNTLTEEDTTLVLRLLQVDDFTISNILQTAYASVFVRSVFLPHHSFRGTLYRVGEHCLAKNGDQQFVLRIDKIFSLRVPPQNIYYTFIKGFQLVNSGVDEYSDNVIVHKDATVTEPLVLAKDIIRKVMLYPHSEPRKFIVIEYQRPEVNLICSEVLIPQYPEVGDMVLINGEDDNVWLAHVCSVNRATKTCQVFFYIPHRSDSSGKMYIKERHRLETIHWQSILEIQAGTWLADGTFHAE